MEVNKTDSGTGALVFQVKAEGAGPVHLEVSGRGPHQCLSGSAGGLTRKWTQLCSVVLGNRTRGRNQCRGSST